MPPSCSEASTCSTRRSVRKGRSRTRSGRPAGCRTPAGARATAVIRARLTDTVTWMFADGPRQAISMESTFEFGAAKIVNGVPVLPDSHQRALNWSAVRDEVQDFTRNVRAVSGGGGLITDRCQWCGGAGRCRRARPTAGSAPDRQRRLERRSRRDCDLPGGRRSRADLPCSRITTSEPRSAG